MILLLYLIHLLEYLFGKYLTSSVYICFLIIPIIHVCMNGHHEFYALHKLRNDKVLNGITYFLSVGNSIEIPRHNVVTLTYTKKKMTIYTYIPIYIL